MSKPFRFAVQAYSAGSAKEWRDLACRAEDLGYSTLHLADHYIGPGPALDPTNHPVQGIAAIPAMMAAACATDTLRVGCRVLCAGYHNPVVLAKELATIDLLSDGRLEVGVGAGWLANEYDAIGVPFPATAKRLALLEETVDVLEAFFAGVRMSVSGQHVRATGFDPLPVPVQQPRPPLMLGGGGPKALTLAARRADIVSFNFDNRAGVIGPDALASGSAIRTAEKVEVVRAAAGDRFADLELEIGAYFTTITDDDAAVASMAAVFGMDADTYRWYPHALAGSVDSVAGELERRRSEYGISYVTVGASSMEAMAPVVARLAGR